MPLLKKKPVIIVFELHVCYYIYQQLILFIFNTNPEHEYITITLCTQQLKGHLGCFKILIMKHKAAINIVV